MRMKHVFSISVLFFVLSFGFVSCDDENVSNAPTLTPTPKFTITLTSSDEEKGTVTGGGTYDKDTKITLVATPKSGYKFVKWNDENIENPRLIIVNTDMTFAAIFEAVPPTSGIENGYTWVDLGLSVKWATCNVGADSIHHYGNYFAWGEVEPKSDYSWENYFDTTDEGSTFVKYNLSGGGTILEKEDDVAAVKMGGSWRMPNREEMEELIDKCTWKWTDNYNGTNIKGKIATGPNGNSIFFPAAGFRRNDKSCNKGSQCVYWSNSLENVLPNTKSAFVLFFESDIERSSDYYKRYEGRNVRGVCD